MPYQTQSVLNFQNILSNHLYIVFRCLHDICLRCKNSSQYDDAVCKTWSSKNRMTSALGCLLNFRTKSVFYFYFIFSQMGNPYFVLFLWKVGNQISGTSSACDQLIPQTFCAIFFIFVFDNQCDAARRQMTLPRFKKARVSSPRATD